MAAAAKLTMMETKRERGRESGEGCWKMDEAEVKERERKIAQEITISPSSADRLRTTLNFQVARVSQRAKHAACSARCLARRSACQVRRRRSGNRTPTEREGG